MKWKGKGDRGIKEKVEDQGKGKGKRRSKKEGGKKECFLFPTPL